MSPAFPPPAPSQPSGVAIAHDDLALLAEVAMLRFPLRAAESQRLERMRTVLDAAADLARALESHTHCALVNHRGSHGTGDLAAETATLSAALQRYGRLVAEVATEYRRFVRERAVPVDTLALDARPLDALPLNALPRPRAADAAVVAR